MIRACGAMFLLHCVNRDISPDANDLGTAATHVAVIAVDASCNDPHCESQVPATGHHQPFGATPAPIAAFVSAVGDFVEFVVSESTTVVPLEAATAQHDDRPVSALVIPSETFGVLFEEIDHLVEWCVKRKLFDAGANVLKMLVSPAAASAVPCRKLAANASAVLAKWSRSSIPELQVVASATLHQRNMQITAQYIDHPRDANIRGLLLAVLEESALSMQKEAQPSLQIEPTSCLHLLPQLVSLITVEDIEVRRKVQAALHAAVCALQLEPSARGDPVSP